MEEKKKLCLDATGKKLFGVCSGIAKYFKIDPTLVRLGFVLVTLFYGCGLFAYLLAWAIMPADPEEEQKRGA